MTLSDYRKYLSVSHSVEIDLQHGYNFIFRNLSIINMQCLHLLN